MASFFDDWNELARNQKSAAEVAADAFQDSLSTWANFQINKMSLESDIKQKSIRNARDDRLESRQSFNDALDRHSDDPVTRNAWWTSPSAQKHASEIGMPPEEIDGLKLILRS
jgi:hypothetical protein